MRSARSAGERERALTSGEPTPIGRRWQVGAEAKLAGTAEKKEEGAVVEEGGGDTVGWHLVFVAALPALVEPSGS